jgi:hypothetical protein
MQAAHPLMIDRRFLAPRWACEGFAGYAGIETGNRSTRFVTLLTARSMFP